MNTAKRTILCVDDETDIVNALYDTFMDTYNVKTATSGEDALKIFNEEDIALVISDQRMPKMEGTELLGKINEIKPKCKKILLTGYADINAAIDAINKGAVDKYFAKPWNDEELVKAVENLIRSYENDMSFAKLIDDTRSLKDSVKRAKHNFMIFENFFNTYLCGVCLVSNENKIEYLNKAGLEFLKYGDIAQLQGKNAEEVFLLTNPIKTFFKEKYVAREQLFDTVYVKTNDGSLVEMKLSLTFEMMGDSIGINAIVFIKAD